MRCVLSCLLGLLIGIVSSRNDEYSRGDVYRKSENFTGITVKDRIDCPGRIFVTIFTYSFIFKFLNFTKFKGDKKQSCADGYTCCESPSGDYACCPHVNAVCCQDHIHCCPQGSTCEVGRCKKV